LFSHVPSSLLPSNLWTISSVKNQM
jgi:hypothetical protein